jgi:glyoxylase-like metal-dependent hydrolase (beta-lactamase superfamily II)
MHSISRRGLVISAATAAGAFGLSGPLAIIGDAKAQGSGSGAGPAGHLKYKVGDIEAFSIHDGHNEFTFTEGFARNAKLDDVKAAVKAAQGSDERIRIPFTMTALRNGDRITLIDTGTGAQVSPTAGQYMANLQAAGIDHTKVSAVLISHFHGDHIFGLMAKDTNAQVFPNAQILVSETEYKHWTQPDLVDKVPEARKGLVRRIQATFPTWKNVSQFQWGKEVVPGVTSVAAPGHTPGHTAFLVASGGQQLMVQGDVSNVAFLFAKNPNWHFAFDEDGPKAEETRRAMYDRVIADKAMIAGYHWGFPNVGTIAKDGNGYAFTPVKA